MLINMDPIFKSIILKIKTIPAGIKTLTLQPAPICSHNMKFENIKVLSNGEIL